MLLPLLQVLCDEGDGVEKQGSGGPTYVVFGKGCGISVASHFFVTVLVIVTVVRLQLIVVLYVLFTTEVVHFDTAKRAELVESVVLHNVSCSFNARRRL